MASRSAQRAQDAIEELRKETGKEALFLQIDLADLQSVKRAANEFLRYVHCLSFSVTTRIEPPLTGRCSKEERLDVLFNSGGLMYPPVEQTTKDGYDLQFGTNVIGAWDSRSSLRLLPRPHRRGVRPFLLYAAPAAPSRRVG